MVNILYVIMGTVIISILGGGLFYFIWLKTRPTKMAWKARVYTLGDGIVSAIRDNDGNIISSIPLSDLRPYTKDTLQKVERSHGIVIYKLLKLNAPTNEPSASSVDYWGPDDKEVNILKDGESYTILKKGYDRKTGAVIFQPLPYETSSMLQNQVILRKNRLKVEKDVLAQITPWVVTGIVIMGLVAVGWLLGDSFVKISESTAESTKYAADAQLEAANVYKEGIMMYKGIDPTRSQTSGGVQELGRQDTPPSIE